MPESRIIAVWIVAAVVMSGLGLATASAGSSGDSAEASETSERESDSEQQESSDVIDHSSFEELLERYVDADGDVDYRRWAQSESDRQQLGEYVDSMGDADARGHSRQAVLAMLINAYNALVIDDVLERWPVENVLEEDGFFDEKQHRVLQASMTLDRLDKELIRQRYGEPRVNFVLVCAAASCPPLRREAMTADNLEESLRDATTGYIPQVTELDDQGRVHTSKLFEWYGEEFEEEAGSVASYLAQYVDGALQEALESEDVEIEFSDYDWSINQL